MQGLLDQINNGFGILVSYLYPLLFADIGGIPLIVQLYLIVFRMTPLNGSYITLFLEKREVLGK